MTQTWRTRQPSSQSHRQVRPDVGRERVHLMTYLEITLTVSAENRPSATEVFYRFKQPFLDTVAGARSKELLVREADVQVLHGFDTPAHAAAYVDSALFAGDIVTELAPLLAADPEIRIYQVA